MNTRTKQSNILVFILAIVVLIPSSTTQGDLIPPEVEILEIFMEAVAADGELLRRAFGKDPNPLSFSGTIDPVAQVFDYDFDSGSTYAGQPLTLSGDGIYDGIAGLWTGGTAGDYGGDTWSSTWDTTVLSVDPYEKLTEWVATPLASVSLDLILSTKIVPGFFFNSITTATYTKNGVPQYSILWNDYVFLNLVFELYDEDGNIYLIGEFDEPTGNVIGTLFVPEPTTMCLLGLGGLLLRRRKKA